MKQTRFKSPTALAALADKVDDYRHSATAAWAIVDSLTVPCPDCAKIPHTPGTVAATCGKAGCFAGRVNALAARLERAEEQIALAAITRDGVTFYGFDHAQAYNAAQQKMGEDLGGFDQGFLTTRGRYVSRDEAYEIAVACGQVVNDNGRGFLISEMLPGHPLHTAVPAKPCGTGGVTVGPFTATAVPPVQPETCRALPRLRAREESTVTRRDLPRYRIAAPKISPHCGHVCEIVPLANGKRAHHGKSRVKCDCGETVVLMTRNLRIQQAKEEA